MEDSRTTRIVNLFCLVVLLFGSAFVVFTLGYTTFLFMDIEKETTRNKVAALLLERQNTLDGLRVTPAKTNARRTSQWQGTPQSNIGLDL